MRKPSSCAVPSVTLAKKDIYKGREMGPERSRCFLVINKLFLNGDLLRRLISDS
jgi:hypothetical protein